MNRMKVYTSLIQSIRMESNENNEWRVHGWLGRTDGGGAAGRTSPPHTAQLPSACAIPEVVRSRWRAQPLGAAGAAVNAGSVRAGDWALS